MDKMGKDSKKTSDQRIISGSVSKLDPLKTAFANKKMQIIFVAAVTITLLLIAVLFIKSSNNPFSSTTTEDYALRVGAQTLTADEVDALWSDKGTQTFSYEIFERELTENLTYKEYFAQNSELVQSFQPELDAITADTSNIYTRLIKENELYQRNTNLTLSNDYKGYVFFAQFIDNKYNLHDPSKARPDLVTTDREFANQFINNVHERVSSGLITPAEALTEFEEESKFHPRPSFEITTNEAVQIDNLVPAQVIETLKNTESGQVSAINVLVDDVRGPNGDRVENQTEEVSYFFVYTTQNSNVELISFNDFLEAIKVENKIDSGRYVSE